MVPIPTKFPARRQMNEIIVQMEIIISTTFPYLLAYTSGSVSARSTLIFRAKKTAFKMRERPRPIGSTAPSQKLYLYESMAFPRIAFESMAEAAKVAVTIWNSTRSCGSSMLEVNSGEIYHLLIILMNSISPIQAKCVRRRKNSRSCL